jgi:PPM family protein phosphatase
MNHDSPMNQDTPMNHDARNQWRAIISPPLNIEPFHPLSSAMALEVAADSVRGKWRAHNTDHYLAVRNGRLQETLITSLGAADLPPRFEEYAYSMLVADGLAEDAGGARASRVALSALAHLGIEYGRWNVRVNVDTTGDIVQQAEFLYRRANDAVIEASRAHAELGDMATSLTAAYVAEDDLFLFHVGHSRAYLFRDGILTQVTATHTLDTHRGDGSRPTRLQRARQDLRHFVTETIGGRTTPEPAMEHLKLSVNDRLLLCTNGLTDVVTDDRIAHTLAARRGPKEECRSLIDLAREADGPDDVTVLVADYMLRRRS